MPTVTPSRLAELIAAQDWTAVTLAQQQGPAAGPLAGQFLENDNAGVRFLAISCIVAAGGPEASRLLLQAVLDPDEQARTTAAKALLDYPPRSFERDAFRVWDQQPDPTVRYYLTLSLGMVGDSVKPGLQQRLAQSQQKQPRSTTDSLIGALARLNDQTARKALRDMLAQAYGSRVAAVLEVFRYVGDSRNEKFLRPLLDRREDAIDLSDHQEDFKRRTCDLAVDELVRLAPGRLTFPADHSVRYSADQVAEARRYVDSLPEPEFPANNKR